MGASAAPARGLVTRSRAASGISVPALRPEWVLQTLDWDRLGAGNARAEADGLRPGWRSKDRTSAASQEAWPGAELGGDNRPTRAAVERREASGSPMGRSAPCPLGAGRYDASLGVPASSFYFSVARVERSETRERN